MNDDIRTRFIEDYGLPISVPYEPWFSNNIALLEKYYKSRTKYNDLVKEIGDRTPGQFIAQNREIRHEIRSWIEGNKAYLEFSGDKEIASHYKISKEYPKRDLYKGDNVGNRYISIDLREANFQALRFHDPAIVRDCETWSEFIGKWSDSDYLKNTKLNRQRLLGKLSPEKQSIIETYIMSGIHEMLTMRQTNLELVSLKTDEIIYKIGNNIASDPILSDALWVSAKDMGIRVRAEVFKLRSLQLFTTHGNSIFGFYKKYEDKDKPVSFHGIPKIYLPQFIKFYEGRFEEVNNFDLAFLTPQDNEIAIFINPLHQILNENIS